MNSMQQSSGLSAILPTPDGKFIPCPSVMTEEELIRFLRIPEISNAKNHRNVIEHLKRTRGLPRIHLCGKSVYPTDAVKSWLENQISPVVNSCRCWYNRLGLTQALGQHRKGGKHERAGKA